MAAAVLTTMPPVVLNHKISGGGPYVDAFAAAAAAVALVLCAACARQTDGAGAVAASR